MREFFTSLLDVLGLLLIAAAIYVAVGGAFGLALAGGLLLLGSAFASRSDRSPRSST